MRQMSVAPSRTLNGHSMASQRSIGDRARRDVIYLLDRLRSFRRQTKAEQVDKIRRCRVCHINPESDLPLILNRQNIFRGLSRDEQVRYARDMYEIRHSLGHSKRDDINLLFVCPLITQYIQTVRGGQFRTSTNNWFQWFAENHERYTWDMTQEEELILQNHIFQYQIMRPLPHQPVRLPPIQQYPLPQTPLPRLEHQLQLPQPVYQQSQPDASSGEHSHHQYYHHHNH